MNACKISLLILLLTLFTTLTLAKEKDDKENTAALGFNFGISKEQAFKIIKSQDKEIIENTVDSKKIRTIMVEGAFIELPIDTNGIDVKTRLEFYDDELMSSSLIFNSNNPSKQAELETELSKFLGDLYGGPGEREKILNFTTWTWQTPDMAIVLSTNPDNNVAKIEYTYKPLNQSKIEEEYERQQKGPPVDKAKEMFLKEPGPPQ